MIRRPTLRTMGIVGAVAGVIGLVAPPIWKSFQSMVAMGRVVPSSIRRPLWLIKSEAADRWREVGQIYPPPGTWASRVCVSDREVRLVRLALVLADDRLDAAFSRLVPEPEKEEEIPEWLKRGARAEQQGGDGRRHGFASLPAGAALVTSVDVRVAGSVFPFVGAPSPSVSFRHARGDTPFEQERRRGGVRLPSW